ncbi:hypothetical protein RND71_004859 [Anisodus tanguticus]|uniref:Uncharacterized protein n=1 Tax=Anisodus tanguticus TaxID=243964 RepID=A0AAE1VM22_9SOLA|nr:hypothetical protein RND71_004859 [Anisodus tanguticus]
MSPKDVGRSSAVSQTFMFAAESDIVWEKVLPSDYEDIISRSDSFLASPSKKQLYFSLSNSPILLDGGKVSFSLDKNGKKCFMVAARELAISRGDILQYWDWLSHPDSSVQIGRRFQTLKTAYAYARFIDCESENEAEKRASDVRLSTKEGPHEKQPHTERRVNGWMEIDRDLASLWKMCPHYSRNGVSIRMKKRRVLLPSTVVAVFGLIQIRVYMALLA